MEKDKSPLGVEMFRGLYVKLCENICMRQWHPISNWETNRRSHEDEKWKEAPTRRVLNSSPDFSVTTISFGNVGDIHEYTCRVGRTSVY